MSIATQWWGFSTEHGWVIMDRDIPENAPGLRGDLLFFRCRDGKVFFVKREQRSRPAYQYAPNYVSAQPPSMAAGAGVELEALMERWPEFQLEILRRHKEITDEREAEARAEAKRAKSKAEATKKQRAATEGLRLVPAPKVEQ